MASVAAKETRTALRFPRRETSGSSPRREVPHWCVNFWRVRAEFARHAENARVPKRYTRVPREEWLKNTDSAKHAEKTKGKTWFN